VAAGAPTHWRAGVAERPSPGHRHAPATANVEEEQGGRRRAKAEKGVTASPVLLIGGDPRRRPALERRARASHRERERERQREREGERDVRGACGREQQVGTVAASVAA
jgi:hypothetical protein